jgi:osmotically-inducible protein OsmY
MKIKLAITAAAVAMAMGAAQAGDAAKRTTTLPAGGTIHTGAMTYEDQLLVDRIADALASDRQLQAPGITVTVTAKNGKVALSGSADSLAQAYRAERIVKNEAGAANVAGTLSTEGG